MFTRTIQLIGEEGFAALQRARVILFGVGGVGGWCAEALLRTGIGHLTLVDFDKVDTTNLNRQVVATYDNIGQSKVLEMQEQVSELEHTVSGLSVSIQEQFAGGINFIKNSAGLNTGDSNISHRLPPKFE